MHKRMPVRVFILSLLLLGAVGYAGVAAASNLRATENLTPLDTYVAKADPNYSFELVSQYDHDEFTGYVIKMVSQQWRSKDEVDRPLWEHWLEIIVPEKLESGTALMFITGGHYADEREQPKGRTATLTRIARNANAVAACISSIPNEPLAFSDEKGRRRSEDSIIAYTWDKYMRTGDAEWILRLPMTKAVVRAMDTVQAFCASEEGGQHEITGFVTAGASKRGWTTWTTAAVDKRVVACIPMVIDLLNLVPSFEHHYAVYGDWAPAVGDYVKMHIMDWLNTPEFKALMGVVEPYSYRERLTIPKYIMNGTQDQFFLPDSSHFYINDLKGPTWLRYVPNAGHGLDNTARGSALAFFASVVKNASMPEFTWSFPDDNTIRVETSDNPESVKLWAATSETRNFRIEVLGRAYTATELQETEKGVFTGHVETPEKGWTAFLIELSFPGPCDDPFIATTPVCIVPRETPFKWTTPANPPKGFLSK